MNLAWDSKNRKERAAGAYQRERSADPYHSHRWTRLSRAYRAMHPLCAECHRQGKIVAATCVDHIIPYPVCADFFDEKNLQSLCSRCNNEKGQRDKKIIAEWRKNHPEDKVC